MWVGTIFVYHTILAKKKIMNRIFICDFLLKRNENDPFLKQIIIGEKWILHNNWTIVKQARWSTTNNFKGRSLHEEAYALHLLGLEKYRAIWVIKVKHLIWTSTAPNWTIWRQPLMRKELVDVIFRWNNARPHISLMTQIILLMTYYIYLMIQLRWAA